MRILQFINLFSLFIVFTGFSNEHPISRKSKVQLYCVTQATQSLDKWNDYLRNDLEALHQDGWAIYVLGLDYKNEFAEHVGKRSLGSYFIRTGRIENGIQLLKDVAYYFERAGNFEILTETLNEIGNGFVYNSEPKQALTYYMQSLDIGKKSDDPTSAFLAEINLAQAYLQLKQIEKAKDIVLHYKKLALFYKKFEAVSSAYALLGSIAQAKNQIELAKEYFMKSAKFGFKSNANGLIGQAFTNYAIALFIEDKIALAKSYFNQALVYRLKTNNKKSIAEAYYNLGDFYFQSTEIDIAIDFFQKSLSISQKNHLFQDQMDALSALFDCYDAKNDIENQLIVMQQKVECQQYKLDKENQFFYQDEVLEKSVLEDKLKKQATIKIELLKRDLAEKNKLVILFSLIFSLLFFGTIIFIAQQSIQSSREN